MAQIRTSEAIFADAKAMYEAALERLEADDIRDAAEKAWCATRRATDALILVMTDREPERVPETTRELRRLGNNDSGVALLVDRYAAVRDFFARRLFLFRPL